jgi:CoA binding domain
MHRVPLPALSLDCGINRPTWVSHIRLTNLLTWRRSRVTVRLLRDCEAAGIKRVWMYRAGGTGAAKGETVRFCESHGMDVIPGECPFLCLLGGAWYHRWHQFVRKISGAYPRE